MKRRFALSLTISLALFALDYFLLSANFAVGFTSTAAPRSIHPPNKTTRASSVL